MVRVSAVAVAAVSAAADEFAQWQHRPLDAFYPVLFLDAIVVR